MKISNIQCNHIKLWILMMVGGMVTILSCNEDVLEETPLDFLSPENAFLSEDGVLQGVTALHQRVRDAYFSFTEFGTMNWRAHGSDLGYMGENPLSKDYLNDNKDVNPTRRYVVDYWNTGFQIIQIANVLINKIESLEADVLKYGDKGKNMYLGEARFFRSFIYRYLVSNYGDISLLKDPVETARADFVRDPVSEIHNLMEEDFKYASEHLPDPGNETAPGRITKGVALHFLGETYLEQGRPEAAIEVLSRVIDDFGYDLMTERFGNHLGNDIFGSGDVYYDLFGFENHNLSENSEAMWVIQVEPFMEGGGQIGSAYIFGPRYYDLGLTPDGYQAFLGTIFEGRHTGYSDIFSRGTANIRGTSLVFYKIWQGDWDSDIRNAEHNLIRNFYYDNPESSFHGKKVDFDLYDPPRADPLGDTTKILYPIHTKFLDPKNYFLQPNRAGGGITHKDWYALRFAETLLLRAEAYLEAGNRGLAAKDVNVVRGRATASLITAVNIDIDFMLEERAGELYGEEWRLVKLRRTGKLLERVLKYNDHPVALGLNMEAYFVLWPIPQGQIDLN